MANTYKSIRNFLKSALLKAELSDNQYDNLINLLNKAKNQCCPIVGDCAEVFIGFTDAFMEVNNTTNAQITMYDEDTNEIIFQTVLGGDTYQAFCIPLDYFLTKRSYFCVEFFDAYTEEGWNYVFSQDPIDNYFGNEIGQQCGSGQLVILGTLFNPDTERYEMYLNRFFEGG